MTGTIQRRIGFVEINTLDNLKLVFSYQSLKPVSKRLVFSNESLPEAWSTVSSPSPGFYLCSNLRADTIVPTSLPAQHPTPGVRSSEAGGVRPRSGALDRTSPARGCRLRLRNRSAPRSRNPKRGSTPHSKTLRDPALHHAPFAVTHQGQQHSHSDRCRRLGDGNHFAGRQDVGQLPVARAVGKLDLTELRTG